MIQKIKIWMEEQMFCPSIASMFFNPFYFARKGLYGHIKSLSHYITGKALDVGCGRKPYRHLFTVDQYIGIDTFKSGHKHCDSNIDLFYDGTQIPFPNGYFDSAILTQVLEHVSMPDTFLYEINRILKPGGTFLITVPFVWDEHEQPFDYARYSSFGLRDLLVRNGFKVIEHRKSMDDLRVIFQMTNAYIYKKTVTQNGKLNLLFMLTLMAPFNILGEIAGILLPRNNDLYLDNIILARKTRCLKG